jgi:branched-chain amino acid transport system permease protein
VLTVALVSGLAVGSMYGLIALGFALTYAVSGTVNFAQGSAVMLGAVLCYTFAVTLDWPMVLAILAALACCAVYGIAVERLAVRPFAARGSNGWLLATVALGIVADNGVMALFGKGPQALPSSLADMPVIIGGVGVLPLQMLLPGAAVLAAIALRLLMTRTALGLRLDAAVQNAAAAELMGIDVGRLITGCYAASAVLAGFAGLLIAPLYAVSYDMGTLFGIKAFAVAILGGMTNATGIIVAGLLYGLLEAGATTYLGSGTTQIVTFSSVLLALALAPEGLFAVPSRSRA